MINTENTKSLSSVLAHHGIVAPAQEGFIFACLTCGSVGGVAPGTPEADRVRTRDNFDFTCSEDSTVLF